MLKLMFIAGSFLVLNTMAFGANGCSGGFGGDLANGAITCAKNPFGINAGISLGPSMGVVVACINGQYHVSEKVCRLSQNGAGSRSGGR